MKAYPTDKEIGLSRVYNLKTQVKTFVNKKTSVLKTHIKLRQTLTNIAQGGVYYYKIEQLESIYDNRPILDPLTELAQTLNKELKIESDSSLYFENLYNAKEIYQDWRGSQARESFLRKHRNNENLLKVVEHIENQLRKGEVAPQMRNKGQLGILFPALMNTQGNVCSRKPITQFIGQIDLPLLLEQNTQLNADGQLQIEAEGRLDAEVFDRKSLQRMMRDLVDAPNFQIDFSVGFKERYVLEKNTGFIEKAGQHLRVMVQGAYLTEIIQELNLTD